MTETPDWRTRRWEATHRRLFATALALFEDFGYERVSVNQIAKRADVSVPTFYAHYPSKEHLIMALPTAEMVGALLASQPAELPMGERIRRALPVFLAEMPPDEQEAMRARWRIIAATPTLRTRAAEFERRTAGMFLDSLASSSGKAPGPVEVVQTGAALVAYTTGLLNWADSNGELELVEAVDRAFRALSD
ncbi:TetR/AcrR family transcriptional regulator [Blastococcus aurantiacus]|uniref:TetR/AcrR family transcriptional regulator n=1 Tax=Blastococcus aurantiacus TaxID=1550231 RepID=UPI0015A15C76|nr:TetR/AcrR family transcriptional regulator [Blastococcus aurantiacus]